MPLFEYRCARCRRTHEQLLARAGAKPEACPHCGSRQVARQLSVFAPPGRSAAPASACAQAGACPASGACATGACPLGA